MRLRFILSLMAAATAVACSSSTERPVEWNVQQSTPLLPRWEVVNNGDVISALGLNDDGEGWAVMNDRAWLYAGGQFTWFDGQDLGSATPVLAPDGKTGWAALAGTGKLSHRITDSSWTDTNPIEGETRSVWYDVGRAEFLAQVLQGDTAEVLYKADGGVWSRIPGLSFTPGEKVRSGAQNRWWRLKNERLITPHGRTLDKIRDFWAGQPGHAVILTTEGALQRLAANGQWVAEPMPGNPTIPADAQIWMNSTGQRGFVYGTGGILLEYANGTWGERHHGPAVSEHLLDVAFTEDGKQGWLLSQKSVLHLQNGRWHQDQVSGPLVGEGWTALATDASGSTALIVGDSGVWARKTGDHDWVAEQDTALPRLNDVWLDSSGTLAYAVGERAIVRLSNATRTWSRLPVPPDRSSEFIRITGSERLNRLWISSSEGWGTSENPPLLTYRLDADSLGPLSGPFPTTTQDAVVLWAATDDTTAWARSSRSPNRLLRRSGDQWRPYGDFLFAIGPVASAIPNGTVWVFSHDEPGTVQGCSGTPASMLGPDTAQQCIRETRGSVRAVWMAADGSDGWAVGTQGLVLRLRLPGQVPPARLTSGSARQLTGTYSFTLGSGAKLALQSIQVSAGGRQITLAEGNDYQVLRAPEDGTHAVRILASSRLAAEPFLHENVALRFNLQDTAFTPAKVVSLQTEGVRLEGYGARWYAAAAVGCLLIINLILLALAVRYRGVREFLFHPVGSQVVGLVLAKYLVVDAVARFITPVRRALFSDYRKNATSQHPASQHWETAKYVPPSLQIERTPLTGDEAIPEWERAYRAIRATRSPGVWLVIGRSGLGKTALLENWFRLSLDLGDTPFLVRLGRAGSIADELRTSMVQYGGFPREAPPLFERSGFVYMLDGLNEDINKDATLQFVREMSARNVVIVSSQFDPEWGDVQVRRVQLAEYDRNQLSQVIDDAEIVDQVFADDRLRQWATLPHSARLLADYVRETGEVPRTQVALYARLRDRLESSALIAALEATAWRLFEKRELLFKPDAQIEPAGLDNAVRAGVLTKQTMGKETLYRFVHERIHRFFVASYLFRQEELNVAGLHARLDSGVGRGYWADVLEFWGELIALSEVDGNQATGAYEAFLKHVGQFHVRSFQRLYLQAAQLGIGGRIQLTPDFNLWAAQVMASAP